MTAYGAMTADAAKPGRAAGVAAAWSPRGGPIPSSRAQDLLGRADALLGQAVCADEADTGERFRLAYVAAVRGAAAVLAVSPAPRRRGASRSAWVQLCFAAPELTGWADYFADHSAARQAVEAGVTGRVGGPLAEEIVAVAREFLDAVEALVVSVDLSAGNVAGAVHEPLPRGGVTSSPGARGAGRNSAA